MVKSQTGDLFYEELKSDEKILIRWYKGDLVSVYIHQFTTIINSAPFAEQGISRPS